MLLHQLADLILGDYSPQFKYIKPFQHAVLNPLASEVDFPRAMAGAKELKQIFKSSFHYLVSKQLSGILSGVLPCWTDR